MPEHTRRPGKGGDRWGVLSTNSRKKGKKSERVWVTGRYLEGTCNQGKGTGTGGKQRVIRKKIHHRRMKGVLKFEKKCSEVRSKIHGKKREHGCFQREGDYKPRGKIQKMKREVWVTMILETSCVGKKNLN